jgi:kinesin family protein 5
MKEITELKATVLSLQSANDELKRAFAVTAAASEGGKNLAESAKEMERIRRTMTAQLADFDNMKKSLMRDLQDRCEKVVELEISLDETREQYNNVLRNSNSKAQQRKMEFLTRNLDQLAIVQRQVRRFLCQTDLPAADICLSSLLSRTAP